MRRSENTSYCEFVGISFSSQRRGEIIGAAIMYYELTKGTK